MKETMAKITRATLNDLEAVMSLLGMQFDDHEIDVGAGNLRGTVETMLRDDEKGVFLLAWDGERPVGLAAMPVSWILEHGGKALWLDELFVLPAYWRLGIGGALLAQVEETARALGCLAIDLEVDADHHRAENLYARAGFLPHKRNRWFKRLA